MTSRCTDCDWLSFDYNGGSMVFDSVHCCKNLIPNVKLDIPVCGRIEMVEYNVAFDTAQVCREFKRRWR